MNTIDRYLIKYFMPIFLVGLLLFITLLQLIDLFSNLWKYLSYDALIKDIALVALYYIPKCVSYSLPISLLFAIAYVLGDLYAHHELTVFFSSGISLKRLTIPFLTIGFALSIGSFFFEDNFVIPSMRQKKDLSRLLLRNQKSGNESDVIVKSDSGKLIYSVDYYNDTDRTLNGVIIIERDDKGRFTRNINARRAVWNGIAWNMEGAIAYEWHEGILEYKAYTSEGEFRDNPDTFRRNAIDVEELKVHDAQAFIKDLQSSGLPYTGALADYYRRFAFSATPFVVILLSISVGGKFNKNILLMSLLTGLLSSVVYYVFQMITMMLAKLGYLPPVIGAWSPVVLFVIIGTTLIAGART